MSRAVAVRVPATSANLGPGLDCLGVALGLHLVLRLELAEAAETVGGDPAMAVGDDLVHRAFAGSYAAVDQAAPPVRVVVEGTYPVGRGLGSSASAIVAGLVGARAFGDLDLPDTALAGLAIRIEGHPDNVLPALLGGLVLMAGDRWIRLEPAPSVAPLLLIAGSTFATSEARKALPGEVTRGDAVANAAATAALVTIVTGAAGEQGPPALLAATADRLHEPYRLPLMAETREVHKALRGNGVAAALSGAGPSVIALVPQGDLDRARSIAEANLPDGWTVATPGWDLQGALAQLL